MTTPNNGGAAKAALLISLMLAGCAQYPEWETDPSARQRIFKECMASLPAGPKSTHYNDWAEVVEECDAVAYRQSQVCVANCKLPVVSERAP